MTKSGTTGKAGQGCSISTAAHGSRKIPEAWSVAVAVVLICIIIKRLKEAPSGKLLDGKQPCQRQTGLFPIQQYSQQRLTLRLTFDGQANDPQHNTAMHNCNAGGTPLCLTLETIDAVCQHFPPAWLQRLVQSRWTADSAVG